MKFWKMMMLATVATGGLATSTQAGLLPVTATATPSGANYDYSYGVVLTSYSTLKTGDYFTLFNVPGYVSGSATAPTGWAAGSAVGGGNPSGVVPGTSTLPNLTFTYTGTSSLTGPVSVGTFSFDSSNPPTTASTPFASDTHTPIGGTEANVTSVTPVPAPGPTTPLPAQTPEPASLLLLGLALPIAGVRRYLRGK